MKRLMVAVALIAVVLSGAVPAFSETLEGKVKKTDAGKGTLTMSAQDGSERIVAVQYADSLKNIKSGDRIRVQASEDKASGMLRANSFEVIGR
jgi:Tfp pilus assembly protein FimT